MEQLEPMYVIASQVLWALELGRERWLAEHPEREDLMGLPDPERTVDRVQVRSEVAALQDVREMVEAALGVHQRAEGLALRPVSALVGKLQRELIAPDPHGVVRRACYTGPGEVDLCR